MNVKEFIDAMGLACPKPVILTKKALDAMTDGQTETKVDNEVAKNNLLKLAESMNAPAQAREEDGAYFVVIEKGAQSNEVADETVHCEMYKDAPATGKRTIAIMTNELGHGDPELGKLLMKSFIYTVSETAPLPTSLLFVNGGVKLTTTGSPVLDDIKAMHEAGVEVISCGTCLDFYGLKEDLLVGEISNMYTIYEKMRDTDQTLVISS